MQNDLFSRLVKYGASILELSASLGVGIEMKAIRSQLSRSATSVGANYQESQSASSRADFINKLQIALKELRETLYWLSLLQTTNGVKIDKNYNLTQLIDESQQLIKILNSCVLTAKQNIKRINNE
jgi:four helix bundle protein